MARLDGKIALVTGGSSGIGKAACMMMARENATVIVADVNDKAGKQVAEDIKRSGQHAYYIHLDISSERQVRNAFKFIEKKIGKINVLVNNAGIAGTMMPTDKLEEKDWLKTVNINAKGVFLCTKYAIPHMRSTHSGSIINLSSIAGLIGIEGSNAYSASKGAIRLMTKVDAMNYAKENIRVNSVHPGYIWTPMVENALKAGGNIEQAKQAAGQAHPLGHMGEPDDIAYSIVYLASDESKFMTGAELVIDGGYTAR